MLGTINAVDPIMNLNTNHNHNHIHTSSHSTASTNINHNHNSSSHSIAGLATADHRNNSPWNLDSSRLLQLMMGGIASPSPNLHHYTYNSNENYPTSNPASSPNPSPNSNSISSSISNGSTYTHNYDGSKPLLHEPFVNGNNTLISPSTKSSASNGHLDLGSFFFFNNDDVSRLNKTLPYGWERCLDLKSGEIYIKKCEEESPMMNANTRGGSHNTTNTRSHARASPLQQQHCVEKQDWSALQSYPTISPTQNAQETITMSLFNTHVMPTKTSHTTKDHGFMDKEPSDALSLDLDLRLTNEKRSKVSYDETKDSSPYSKLATNSHVSSKNLEAIVATTSLGLNLMPTPAKDFGVQRWKWQNGNRTDHDSLLFKPTINLDIQEMVRVPTMATATCSHCLTYVLLKKSNPMCPRCSNPITLECNDNSSKKRPYTSLEFSSDALNSLSADSSSR